MTIGQRVRFIDNIHAVKAGTAAPVWETAKVEGFRNGRNGIEILLRPDAPKYRDSVFNVITRYGFAVKEDH